MHFDFSNCVIRLVCRWRILCSALCVDFASDDFVSFRFDAIYRMFNFTAFFSSFVDAQSWCSCDSATTRFRAKPVSRYLIFFRCAARDFLATNFQSCRVQTDRVECRGTVNAGSKGQDSGVQSSRMHSGGVQSGKVQSGRVQMQNRRGQSMQQSAADNATHRKEFVFVWACCMRFLRYPKQIIRVFKFCFERSSADQQSPMKWKLPALT